MHGTIDEAAIFAIKRPNAKLMVYYFLRCLLSGPAFPILIVPHYFKYHTLRFRFDTEGISMRWGILFRREIILNYSRIQDIHLSSNVVERWLGLARIQVQTASSSAGAEMTLEGLLEYEAVRDFLYSKMRGMKEKNAPLAGLSARAGAAPDPALDLDTAAELTAALREASNELRAIRVAIEQKKP